MTWKLKLIWPIARNRGSKSGRQHEPELFAIALKRLGKATLLAIILDPKVGKISKSMAKDSRLSIWNEMILKSSCIGSMMFRGIISEDLDEIVRRAAGYLLSW